MTSYPIAVGDTILAGIAVAISRSEGLVAVTVTVLDPNAEASDLRLPLFRRRESLPDYELSLLADDGHARYLGTRPDESAVGGLTWRLDDPAGLSQVAAVRLREKDRVISDVLAEVQIAGPSAESNGYRFDFQTQRSFGVGVRAFFATPIGMAIAAAFVLALLVIILSSLAG